MISLILGPAFFERFCSAVDRWPIELMKPEDFKSFMARDIYIDEWILNVKKYIMEKEEKLIRDKTLVFVIESQRFRTVTNPSRSVTVMVSTNTLYLYVLHQSRDHINVTIL